MYEFVGNSILNKRCPLCLSSKYLCFGVTVHNTSDSQSHEIIFKTYRAVKSVNKSLSVSHKF